MLILKLIILTFPVNILNFDGLLRIFLQNFSSISLKIMLARPKHDCDRKQIPP